MAGAGSAPWARGRGWARSAAVPRGRRPTPVRGSFGQPRRPVAVDGLGDHGPPARRSQHLLRRAHAARRREAGLPRFSDGDLRREERRAARWHGLPPHPPRVARRGNWLLGARRPPAFRHLHSRHGCPDQLWAPQRRGRWLGLPSHRDPVRRSEHRLTPRLRAPRPASRGPLPRDRYTEPLGYHDNLAYAVLADEWDFAQNHAKPNIARP